MTRLKKLSFPFALLVVSLSSAAFAWSWTTWAAPNVASAPAVSAVAQPDPNTGGYTQAQLLDLIAQNHVQTIEDLIPLLPEPFRRSSTFKHGQGTQQTTQSASHLLPRALLWDNQTGFSVTFNSDTQQPGGDTLEMMGFDRQKSRFEFTTIKFPPTLVQGKIVPEHPAECLNCHGTKITRPIWKMYPDWPGIYGSNNDELTGDHKVTAAQLVEKQYELKEMAFYQEFKQRALDHPRYKFLFPPHVMRSDYASFPFRPDNVEKPADTLSRAFFFRPNLRLGLLLNRLQARYIQSLIEATPFYKDNRDLTTFSFLGCSWQVDPVGAARIAERSRARMAAQHVAVGDITGTRGYEAVLAAMGLQIRDLDIRFSMNNERTDTQSFFGITYPAGNPGLRYRESYFDGSATINELLVAKMIYGLKSQDPLYTQLSFPNETLTSKYAHLATRYALDKTFFNQMDAWGSWLPLDIPAEKFEHEHRDNLSPANIDYRKNLCTTLFKNMRTKAEAGN